MDEYSEDYALFPGAGPPGRAGSGEAGGMGLAVNVRMSYDTAIMGAMAAGEEAWLAGCRGHVLCRSFAPKILG